MCSINLWMIEMVIEIIYPNGRSKTLNLKNIRVSELLKRLGLLSEEYVVARNRSIVTEDDMILDGDKIFLYPVVSGG